MADSIQEAKITGFAAYLPKVAAGSLEQYQDVFETNRHRVYSFAFWMTDSEMAAEELMGNTFRRAFASAEIPSVEAIDKALLAEIRELTPIGTLTLECAVATEVADVRSNIKRVHLERAVVQLPVTERLIYLMHDGEGFSHQRIGSMLGLTEDESKYGLHQARVRIRELVSVMKF
jgi:RNA polymerase sigma-70 factor, ECF subfamily